MIVNFLSCDNDIDNDNDIVIPEDVLLILRQCIQKSLGVKWLDICSLLLFSKNQGEH